MQFDFYTSGQRVRFIYKGIAADDRRSIKYGETGTIVPNPWDEDVAVDWDKEEIGRHDCGGYARKGHGWWVPKNCIEFIS